MTEQLPEGCKLKMGYAAWIEGQYLGQIFLMKPRRFWWGYKKVASSVCGYPGDTDDIVKRRLLRNYERGEWLD